jgi:ribosomal protein L34E
MRDDLPLPRCEHCGEPVEPSDQITMRTGEKEAEQGQTPESTFGGVYHAECVEAANDSA